MKKIFAIVLAGIMMLSLAACGGTGSSTPAAVSSEPAGASGTPASSAPAASTLSGKVTTGGSTSVEKVVPRAPARALPARPRERWTSAFPAVR